MILTECECECEWVKWVAMWMRISVLSYGIFKYSLTMAKQKLDTATTNWAHSATKQQIHEYNNYSKHLKTKRSRRGRRRRREGRERRRTKTKLTTMTTKRIKCRDFALWLRHTTSNTNANMNTTANVNANEYCYPVIFECALMRSLIRVYMYIVCLMALTDFLLFSHELKAHVRCARQNSIIIIIIKKSEKTLTMITSTENTHNPHICTKQQQLFLQHLIIAIWSIITEKAAKIVWNQKS